jgi:hypothetical protein
MEISYRGGGMQDVSSERNKKPLLGYLFDAASPERLLT